MLTCDELTGADWPPEGESDVDWVTVSHLWLISDRVASVSITDTDWSTSEDLWLFAGWFNKHVEPVSERGI